VAVDVDVHGEILMTLNQPEHQQRPQKHHPKRRPYGITTALIIAHLVDPSA
jgi:hypothetical protein